MNGLEDKTPEMERIKEPPGFNWGQATLAICVAIALLFAGWNAFSIMGTDKEMREEDSELSTEIGAVNRGCYFR